ncbi:MAG: hypothetical protein ACRD8O_01230, partial [Bryobacteraceae bacterium]
MKSSSTEAAVRDAAGIRAAVERFLTSSRRPALLEPGEELFDLRPDSFALSERNSRLTIEAWDETRNLVRRVTALGEERRGRLELVIERFARKEGRMWLIDLEQPQAQETRQRGERLVFRERFRRFLSREFSGWRLAELSAEKDLEHTLSPAYPRALLRKGRNGIAAISAPAECVDPDGALSFGLIWLSYLRRRERGVAIGQIVLYLPAGSERTTCQRTRFLDGGGARFEVYAYGEDDSAAPVCAQDYGNFDTRIEPAHATPPEAQAWVERLAHLSFVEPVPMGDGAVSLRVRGLEFARTCGHELLFGLHRRAAAREHNLAEVERLARELADLRSVDAAGPLASALPEAWLESAVRANLPMIDAYLRPSPLYGQVPAWAGGERGIPDLLAADRSGRLAVLELKASEDLHLPLQALDYWMRVKWHLDRGEFEGRGYFPGVALRKEPPRILLVGPALEFHPTTETILAYFSSEVEVERIGLCSGWRECPRVMFRLCGAARPLS